jgi:hypothetical protein
VLELLYVDRHRLSPGGVSQPHHHRVFLQIKEASHARSSRGLQARGGSVSAKVRLKGLPPQSRTFERKT